MYLQKLRLNGFKSFADSTTVQFADGITAIVGPNGCGKSNVIDAVRWVLGEQRARILRSDKMDNVIFNGSGKKRRPLGLAEVELTIENTKHVLPTEFTEVTIARRLYRSGQSEYLLNGVACRLRDIQDLFMDTGMGAGAYSVIELRMIEDMLSDNAQDRRRLFEEAAGITKYKRRRDQALRKLKGTQDNLTRLNDLIEEIAKTVNRLKRQAAKAARYKRFTADFQALALALAQSEFERLSNEQRALHERARTEGDQVEALTAQVDVAEAELETLRVALVDREKELAERQGVLNEHVDTLRQREADRRLNEERRQQAETGIERAGRMEQDAKQRRHDLAEERGRLEREVQSVEPLVQALTAAMAQAETAKTEATDRAEAQRREVERLRRHARERQDALRRAVQERDRVTNRIDLLRDEASRLQAEAATTQDAQAAARSRLAVAQANVANAETARRHAEEEAEEAKARRKRLEADLDRARQALRTSERQADALTAEIALLDELLASYGEAGESVQFLVQTPTWTAETPLTVSDIVRCAPADQRAVDAVLGPYADCFVVADATEAEQAARMLRDEEKGTARFLVLSRLPNVQMASTPAGTEALRQRVQTTEPRYEGLADVLFGRAFLVGSLQAAAEAAERFKADHPLALFVAETGEWAAADGRLRGGSVAADASPMARRVSQRERLGELQRRLGDARHDIGVQQDDVNEVLEALNALDLDAVRQTLRQNDARLSEAVRERDQAQYELKRAERDAVRMQQRQVEIGTSVSDLQQRTADVDAQIEALGQSEGEDETAREAAEEALRAAEEASRQAIAQYGEARVKALNVQNAFDTLKRDARRNFEAGVQLDAQDRQRAQELDALERRLAEAEQQLDGLAGAIEAGYVEKSDLDQAVRLSGEKVNELRAGIAEQELRLRTVRREREDALQGTGRIETRLAEVHVRLEDLTDRTRNELDCELPSDDIEIPEGFDAQTARQELDTLRRKIRDLGAVNELALEEYEEEKQRLDFLTEQRDDLLGAETTLLDTITEINETASERFRETFKEIQGHFSRLFALLFGEGASAKVELAGEKDPLESPIEIFARPRGKRNVTIAQLSGGEKTLTATALLFAIYLVKPSPFCILDEVDAPLDDANIGRFMHLIREFSKDTQFILVTHNKLTMEAADRMYGVTMQEAGVSSVVSVSFENSASAA